MGLWFTRIRDIPIASFNYGSDSTPQSPQKPQSIPSYKSVPPSQIGPITGRPYINITTIYDLHKELGRGQFGTTYLCTERATGRKYACKTISRRKMVNPDDIEDVRREILILQHLTGQPNIVEFKGAYEDEENLHLIMELCSGGELFDRIIKKDSYSEREAASICKQILNVVHACHFMGVMHRDLKPENFLMVSEDDDSPIKATDFGLSVFIEEETEDDILKAVLSGNLEMEDAPWPSISPSAKDLVSKMLRRDPKERITAAEALEHPWLKIEGKASSKPIDSAVFVRMKQFRAMNKFKQLALKVMAENLSEEELKGLKQMFKNIDTDRSGTITLEELKTGLSRLGSRLSEHEIKQLMDAADVDRSGMIDYGEFITATMHRHRLEKEENIYKTFQFFDIDKSGFITRDEVKQAMIQYKMGDEDTIDEILDDIDIDGDGKINFDEFINMMTKGTMEPKIN
ncbi:Calcium-dependent protein kinase 29, partial [Cucurbita argyrosperma subsp. argyrosperma]